MCQLSHHFIKAFRKEGPDRWLPLAVHTSGRHIVAFPRLDHLNHLWKKCRRILQIRIHERHIITACAFQSCIHRRFLAEIAGERDVTHTRILLRQLLYFIQCCILRSIIDKQIFKFMLRNRLRHTLQFPVEDVQCFLFIVHRHHDTYFAHFLLLACIPLLNFACILFH